MATMTKTIHVKTFMERMDEEDGYSIIEAIREAIPSKHDDDVFEFDITIKNIKDATEEVGVDEDGCRAFNALEITEVKE